LHGVTEAAELLVEHVRPTVARQLRLMHLSSDDAGEITQTVSVRLLIGGKGNAPGLSTYGGSTPLAGHAKALAARLALGWNRDARGDAEREAETPTAERSWQADAAAALEPSALAALRAALDGLEPRSRQLLRLHFVDGVSLPEIGRVLSGTRAMVARWLIGAREDLLAGVRAALVERMPADELPDVLATQATHATLATLATRLDLSLARALGGG
jgi:RNA polymerase sigma-70 factor (ECF subfamily)